MKIEKNLLDFIKGSSVKGFNESTLSSSTNSTMQDESTSQVDNNTPTVNSVSISSIKSAIIKRSSHNYDEAMKLFLKHMTRLRDDGVNKDIYVGSDPGTIDTLKHAIQQYLIDEKILKDDKVGESEDDYITLYKFLRKFLQDDNNWHGERIVVEVEDLVDFEFSVTTKNIPYLYCEVGIDCKPPLAVIIFLYHGDLKAYAPMIGNYFNKKANAALGCYNDARKPDPVDFEKCDIYYMLEKTGAIEAGLVHLDDKDRLNLLYCEIIDFIDGPEISPDVIDVILKLEHACEN